MIQTKEESQRIKSLFLTYFDGCYDIDPVEETPSTYEMGVCKLEYKNKKLTVYLRRPGLLIGKAGRTLKALEKYLKCPVNISEVILNEREVKNENL